MIWISFPDAADADKSHSSCRKKRRSLRPQVSSDSAEYIRKKIGKLDLNDITQLARLIEGHDAAPLHGGQSDKQRELQEQILALLDPEESPDPRVLRESVAQLLQGSIKTRVKPKEAHEQATLAKFFQETKEGKPTRPPRKLKGLDAASVRVPDFSDIFDDSADTDSTVVKVETKKKQLVLESPKKKVVARHSSLDSLKKSEFSRSMEFPESRDNRYTDSKFERSLSTEIPIMRLSEIIDGQRRKHSPSPESPLPYARSNSVGPSEVANTRLIAQLFEGNRRYKDRHTPSPETRSARSASVNMEMALRMRRMAEIVEGKRRDTPNLDRAKVAEAIGTPEMAFRRQRVVDLIQGHKPKEIPEPYQRRNSGEMAFRMQRVSDMMQKKTAEARRPKSGGRRRAAREIMKQRFEKSLQMLATEPRLEFAPSADLENDYGLQQYRASAPHFGERVKKLEKQLQHYVRRLAFVCMDCAAFSALCGCMFTSGTERLLCGDGECC